MVTALIIINFVWMVFVVFMICFSKGINIKLDIPEIKINNTPEVIPFEDSIYDEKGNEKEKELVQETLDEVLTSVNKIMFGDDITEGSKDI